MRLAIISGALLAAGCASTRTADNAQPVDRACGVDDCFYERDVRTFEVIEHTTLVVYVGKERCPYQIDLRGAYCDLAFAPEIYFSTPRGAIHENGEDLFGSTSSERLHDLRICRNDINIGVSGGVLTENPTSTQPRGSDCLISRVKALTDDQLIELYVSRAGVAPPPPMGSGRIQVGDQQTRGDGGPSEPSESQGKTQPAPAPSAPTESSVDEAATAATGVR